MPVRIPPLLRSRAFGLLLAVFAFEFLLFDRCGAPRFTALYPRWHDQIQYLTESYTGYEFARSRGLLAGLLHALTNPSSQGTLHDFLSIFAFAVSSPSRSAALSLNILALIAWQGALFIALARATGSRPLAFAVALLPALLAGPWDNIPGSAYDFRLDHLALCALGVTSAAAVACEAFYARSGATLLGITAGLTVLTRFRTGPYLLLVFAGLAAWILWRPPDRRIRGLQLLRAAGIAAIIAVPNLWLNYDAIAGDYSFARYFGRESVLAPGASGLGASAWFVVETLATRHVGIFFGVVATLAAVALAGARGGERVPPNRDLWVVGALFLLAPGLALAFDGQKHEVLTGALVPGVVLLVAAAWSTLGVRAGARGLTVVSTAVTVLALAYFTHRQVPPAYRPAVERDLRQVTTLAQHLQTRARLAGLTKPTVAVDHVSDALDARVLGLLAYERQHVWLPFEGTLPTGTGEPPETLVMERLARSDFVFLTEDAPSELYAFDRRLNALRPQVKSWCDAHLLPADRFTLAGRRMVLYQRPEIPLR